MNWGRGFDLNSQPKFTESRRILNSHDMFMDDNDPRLQIQESEENKEIETTYSDKENQIHNIIQTCGFYSSDQMQVFLQSGHLSFFLESIVKVNDAHQYSPMDPHEMIEYIMDIYPKQDYATNDLILSIIHEIIPQLEMDDLDLLIEKTKLNINLISKSQIDEDDKHMQIKFLSAIIKHACDNFTMFPNYCPPINIWDSVLQLEGENFTTSVTNLVIRSTNSESFPIPERELLLYKLRENGSPQALVIFNLMVVTPDEIQRHNVIDLALNYLQAPDNQHSFFAALRFIANCQNLNPIPNDIINIAFKEFENAVNKHRHEFVNFFASIIGKLEDSIVYELIIAGLVELSFGSIESSDVGDVLSGLQIVHFLIQKYPYETIMHMEQDNVNTLEGIILEVESRRVNKCCVEYAQLIYNIIASST